MNKDCKGLVSVVVPTYKRIESLKETVGSILSQTYSDLEVIVVSDGLQDNLKEALTKFNDERLSYYEIVHSGRPAVPRNFGIAKARGEYICFCDDDDSWLPDKIKMQVEYLNKNIDVRLVFCAFKIESSDIEHNNKVIGPKTTDVSKYAYEKLLNYDFITSSSVMVRFSVFNSIGGFDENPNMAAAEDWDFWLRISREYKIAFIPKVLGIYKATPLSLSADEQHLQKGFFVIDKHLNKKWITQKQADSAKANYYFREAWAQINKDIGASRLLFRKALGKSKKDLKIYCFSIMGLILSIVPFFCRFIKKISLDKKISYWIPGF